LRRPALALLAALAAEAPAASANGRFPAAQHVVMGPGDAARDIALRTTFGLLLSRDGGEHFGWMCEEAMLWPAAPPPGFDPPIEQGARGVVFAGLTGLRHTADGCAVEEVLAGPPVAMADLTRHPGSGALFAVEATAGAANAVYRAAPDGRRFERLGAGVADVIFDTVEVAPSDPLRLYLTGRDQRNNRPRILRSDDGGVTLTALAGTPEGIDSAWVSGVDPNAADTLFVRATVGIGAALYRSTDGGRSFRRLVATPDPMLGFALAPDGRGVWVGGVATGLLRSDDGGDTFRRVHALPVLCLRHHAGALWACSDGAEGPFALGRSTDGGERFEVVLRFEDAARLAGAVACPGAAAEARCADRWPSLRAELLASAPRDAGPPRDAATPRDAGPPRDAATPREPAGCAAAPSREPDRPALALTAAAALGACSARRRRAHRPRPRRSQRRP
jgi:hypothetical protein